MSTGHPSAGDASARTPFPAMATPVGSAGPTGDGSAVGETCDYCGSTALWWRKCKLICESCAQINKSCADL
jgi:hypothetical protein